MPADRDDRLPEPIERAISDLEDACCEAEYPVESVWEKLRAAIREALDELQDRLDETPCPICRGSRICEKHR